MRDPSVDVSERGASIILRDGWQPETIRYTVRGKLGVRYYMTEERYHRIGIKRIRRGQDWALPYRDRIPQVLQDPDVVIVDPQYVDGRTVIYYRCFADLTDPDGQEMWIAVPVEHTNPAYIHTMHPAPKKQAKTWRGRSGKVLYRRGRNGI